MPRVRIEDLTAKRQIALVTGGAGANFRLGSEAIDIAALHQLDSVAQDFLTLAAAVFYADGEVPRGGDTRPGMGKGWHRNLRLHIPVRNLGLWQRTDVTETLSETVRFLTGDTMEFQFSLATDPRAWPEVFEFDPQGATYEVEKVILFSGGLDSFAGALETLSSGPGKVLLVSHRSAQKVLHRQDALAEWLARRFPGRVRHIKVAATRIGAETHDTTQRSRSLLFAAIGHAVAANFGARQLCFFENGIVSHNLPISPQVVGTMATRTTHPQSLVLLNRLLQLISPGSTTIFNEYQWLTKTEVVQRIATYGGAEMIEAAVSCTHVRDQTTLHTHCGRCSQCLDRRFAILAARLEAHDPVERYATAMFTGPLADDRARTLVLEWTRHAISLVDLDEGGCFGRSAATYLGSSAHFPQNKRRQPFAN